MWTVPKSVLRVVALILFACAAGAFALGILGAEPGGGRLPGETASADGATVTTLNAADARPLTEGGAPPAEDEEEQAAAEDESDEAETEVAEAADTPGGMQLLAAVPIEMMASPESGSLFWKDIPLTVSPLPYPIPIDASG